MQKSLVVGAVAASLALASCGVTASLDQAVSSLGSSPNLQIHLTASASGTGAVKAEKILNTLSFDASYSSPSGTALSASQGNVNADFVVNVGSQQLLDLRSIDNNAYLFINATTLSRLPGAHVSSTQSMALQLLVGDRWFEFPKSLLEQYAAQNSAASPSAATKQKDQAAVRDAVNVLIGVIEAAPYTTVPGGGYAQTGSLESIVRAELPILNGLTGQTSQISNVKGTYAVTLMMSGSSATGGSIAITAPNDTSGNQTITLNATVAHANDVITPPANVTIMTSTLLTSIMAGMK